MKYDISIEDFKDLIQKGENLNFLLCPFCSSKLRVKELKYHSEINSCEISFICLKNRDHELRIVIPNKKKVDLLIFADDDFRGYKRLQKLNGEKVF
ncbi:MAG: hypothetical protein KGY74_09535 [Candidatus Cloacimonetes bacterium]|nr:hypothetical protein [Candidatus Cloacimonadota bacterium]